MLFFACHISHRTFINMKKGENNIQYTLNEALPAGSWVGRGEGTCSLVPLEKMALFPKNKILIFYVPCSPYFRPLFLSSPEKIALVPQNPWEGLVNDNVRTMLYLKYSCAVIWAPSSEFVSSSIPSWQILTAHAQPFKGARDLAFCLKVPLDSLLIWASSESYGETARMRRLAWTFAARIVDKYQIRLTRSIWSSRQSTGFQPCSYPKIAVVISD